MALDRLAPIQRVGIHAHAVDWRGYGENQSRKDHQQREQQGRLLAHIAPDMDAESVSVDVAYDADGNLVEATIRDRATGRALRVISRDDLTRLTPGSAPGMLFERRG